MKNKILDNPKWILIVESILILFVLLTLLIFQVNQDYLRDELIQQESEYLSTEIETFLQTGQIFLNSYASDLNISGNIESLVMQLKSALIPFPFFSQLNIIDSSGLIIAGFPQNNIGQNYSGFINVRAGEMNETNVFPAKNDSSLILFIKEIKKVNQDVTYYLIGESDMRANLLNSGLVSNCFLIRSKGY